MRLGLPVGYSGAQITLDMPLIQEADRLGFHVLWTAEAYGSDAVTPLAFIAGQTKQIRLGSGIMQMPARTPAMTAMTATTLDQLSGGRMVLGLGVSGPQVVEGWHGVPYGKPLVRTREYIGILRKIWAREQPLEHEGTHYHIPYRGPDATGLGQAAQEHPARTADPDLHRRDRAEERHAGGRDRRRLAADLLLAFPRAQGLPAVARRGLP